MKNKFVFIFCIVLIVSVVLTSAQFSSDFERQEAQDGFFDTVFDGPTPDLNEVITVNVDEYEPAMIRESHLEQEGVPVFVGLRGETVGSGLSRFTNDPLGKDPFTGLTKFPPIKRMYVKSLGNNPFVTTSPRFVPPRTEMYSLDNLGYLVVKVNKLDENGKNFLKNNSNTIELDMEAEIYFDFESGIGLGITSQDILVPLESDTSKFLGKSGFEQNPFFSSRGFINAIDIGDGEATFVVYDRHFGTVFPSLDNVMPTTYGRALPGSGRLDQGYRPSIRLTKGEYSPVLSLKDTGDPFMDLFRVRLNDIVTSDDRAVFEITRNGITDERIVNKGNKLFYNSFWVLSSVTKPIVSSITLSDAKEDFELDDETYAILNGLPSGNFFKAIHLVDLYGPRGKMTLRREVLQVGDDPASYSVLELSPDDARNLENSYCTADGFLSDGTINFGCAALRNYQNYLASGGTAKSTVIQRIVDIYKKSLIRLDGCMPSDIPDPKNPVCIKYIKDMRDLETFYTKKLVELGVAVPKGKTEIAKGGTLYLDEEGIHIKLKKVEILEDKDKGSVKLRVDNGPLQELFLNSPVNVGDSKRTTSGEPYFEEGGSMYQWRVYKINPRNVVLGKYKLNSLTDTFTPKNYVASSQTFTIATDSSLVYKSEMRTVDDREEFQVMINIEDIKVNNLAYVTVIPGTDNAKATSRFKLYIPVDPRPFEFTPGQMKSQIKKTKEIIDDIDFVLKKLDNIISYWKKTCIITFVTLTAKNSFFAGKGVNLARRSVMGYYKEKCKSEISSGIYKTLDECYLAPKNIEEIRRNVEIEKGIIEQVNNEFKSYKTVEALKDSSTPCGSYLKTGGSVDDCRLKSRLDLMKDKVDSKYYNYVKGSFDPLKYNSRISDFGAATAFYTSNPALFGSSKDEAVDAYLNSKIATDEKITSGSLDFYKLDGIVFKDGKMSAPVGVENVNNKVESFEIEPVTELGLSLRKHNDEPGVLASLGISDHNVLNNELIRMRQTFATVNGYPIYVAKSEFHEIPFPSQGMGNVKTPKSTAKLYYTFVTQEANVALAKSYVRQRNSKTGNRGVFSYHDLQGKALCYPVGDGDYIEVLERYRTGSVSEFRLMNVGANEVIDCGGGDDKQKIPWEAMKYNAKSGFYTDKINSAGICNQEGDVVGNLDLTTEIVCTKENAEILLDSYGPSCADVMDPGDCKLLFNACDPVMCPTSRCNLGGRVKVDNVIQSGVVGSTVLCLPNIDQVAVPVCLTGISAGLKNVQSVLQGYVDCLETSLSGGGDIGICDYIRSVGICEMVWREATNILNIKGGIIDWVSETALGQSEGGVEYLTFQSSLDNVGKSFNYFTTEYSNTFLAAYRGQSSDEIGSQLCRMSVYGKVPKIGDILDQLAEPENPPQYTAFFDSVPYVSTMGDIPGGVGGARFSTDELNLYKAFYHIYAGTGFPSTSSVLGSPKSLGGVHEKPLQFTVFLRSKYEGLPILYVTTNPQSDGRKYLDVEKGKYVQQTVQTVGPKGYDEICIQVTGDDIRCGFGKVTSSFGFNELTDLAITEQVKKEITTASECATTDEFTSTNLGSLTIPFPENYGLVSTGVVRVCNPISPGPVEKWAVVGSCGQLGKCWLLRESAKVSDLGLQDEIEESLVKRIVGDGLLIEIEQARIALRSLAGSKTILLGKLRTLVEEFKRTKGKGAGVEFVEEVEEEITNVITTADYDLLVVRTPSSVPKLDVERMINVYRVQKEDVEYLARMLSAEGAGLTLEEKGAIMQVAKNRRDSSKGYGSSYKEVVTKVAGWTQWSDIANYKTLIQDASKGFTGYDADDEVKANVLSAMRFILQIDSENTGAQRSIDGTDCYFDFDSVNRKSSRGSDASGANLGEPYGNLMLFGSDPC